MSNCSQLCFKRRKKSSQKEREREIQKKGESKKIHWKKIKEYKNDTLRWMKWILTVERRSWANECHKYAKWILESLISSSIMLQTRRGGAQICLHAHTHTHTHSCHKLWEFLLFICMKMFYVCYDAQMIMIMRREAMLYGGWAKGLVLCVFFFSFLL